MKKKLMAVILTGTLCASMAFPATAATGGGAIPLPDGTEVFAGVIVDDELMDAKIKVEVPTLFAFVVNGTAAGAAGGAVRVKSAITLGLEGDTTTAPSLLLPNIKVKASDTDEYILETTGSGNMRFRNYSTKVVTAGGAGRVGLEVKITGNIKNEGTEASRNEWTHVADAASKARGKIKQYTLSIDGQDFNKAEIDTSLSMENPITLDAPDVTIAGVDVLTGHAMVGREQDVAFNVYTSGERNQYNEVEESAKVGTIVWTVATPVVVVVVP